MRDWNKFIKGSRKFLKNYIIDNKLKSCVLGISGGVDSCVSAAIAYPVCYDLGIPLIGRSLPTTSNKIDETTTAFKVGEAFCNDFKEVSIENSFSFVFADLALNEGHITPLQEGNIKARLRMMYLRHLASVHKGVVLDNDNFTEWNLGFWTVGGDSPMDINLGLHYLWKTEIYELADYLYNLYKDSGSSEYKNGNYWGYDYNKAKAIKASMALIPTDGNGVSNSDCEQFGLENYSQVDDVLKTVYYTSYAVCSKEAKDAYIRLIDSYGEQGVDKIMILHQSTEYKRKKLPIKPTMAELEL